MGAKNVLGTNEFGSVGQAIRCVLAEFLGTLLLVLVGCGTCVYLSQPPVPTDRTLQIAIAFGFIIASLVQMFGHVSGCHINPAVTVGLLASCRIGLIRAALYIPAQCVGAIAGAAILKGMLPDKATGSLGLASLSPLLGPWQGAFVEAVLSFLLLTVVCAVTDPNRTDLGNSAPVAIGLIITASHIFAIPFTGSSMNPARALGPATIVGIWNDHWIYWIGPLFGGALAGAVYKLFFSAPKDDENSYDLS